MCNKRNSQRIRNKKVRHYISNKKCAKSSGYEMSEACGVHGCDRNFVQNVVWTDRDRLGDLNEGGKIILN
jgi:hypothetical protein